MCSPEKEQLIESKIIVCRSIMIKYDLVQLENMYHHGRGVGVGTR